MTAQASFYQNIVLCFMTSCQIQKNGSDTHLKFLSITLDSTEIKASLQTDKLHSFVISLSLFGFLKKISFSSSVVI